MIEDSALGLNEVAYHNEPSLIFHGAPSIVCLSSGRLVAYHEYFTMPGYIQIPNVTVYISDDNGQSWSFSSNITHTFFTILTVYNNMIYAIGIDNDSNGGTVIHRSSDNGATWNYNGGDKGVILFREKFAGGALLKKSVLWETQTTSETLSETLFGFREGFRTCKAFSKIPYWFPRSRKPLGFREYRIQHP